MGEFLVAYFHTQMEAVTSAKKLAAYGVQRDRVTIRVPGKLAMGIDRKSQTADAAHDLRSEEPPVIPLPLNNSTTLAVALKDSASINDVCSVLKDAGAYLIDVTEKNLAQEYPDM